MTDSPGVILAKRRAANRVLERVRAEDNPEPYSRRIRIKKAEGNVYRYDIRLARMGYNPDGVSLNGGSRIRVSASDRAKAHLRRRSRGWHPRQVYL